VTDLHLQRERCFALVFSLGFFVFVFLTDRARAPDLELSKDTGWMAFNKEGGVEPAR
jgi:hypothetical protein